jgi:predicted TPR repeat methyltransferase
VDLGCGIVRVVRYVAPLCREIWAVDASQTMLRVTAGGHTYLPNLLSDESLQAFLHYEVDE